MSEDLNRKRAALANKAHAVRKRVEKAAREHIPCLKCRSPFPTECRKRNRICVSCSKEIDELSPMEPIYETAETFAHAKRTPKESDAWANPATVHRNS